MSIAIFGLFVVMVLWLSFFFARRTKSASGYYAAGGQIHWAVNGISFAGDYLSTAFVVGIVAALGIILTGPAMFAGPYGLTAADAWHPLGQPGIISIPLSFLTLVVVSLMTQKEKA